MHDSSSGFKVIWMIGLLCAAVAGPVHPRADAGWIQTVVSGEKAENIKQAAADLIAKHMESPGFLEAIEPETGNFVRLSPQQLEDEVLQTGEQEYLVSGLFSDEHGILRKVDFYLKELSDGSYILVETALLPDFGRFGSKTL